MLSPPENHQYSVSRALASRISCQRCVQASCLAVAPAAEARPPLSAEEEATIGVFRRNTPSVVYITNLANRFDCVPYIGAETVLR